MCKKNDKSERKSNLVNCSICYAEVYIHDALLPQICLTKYGYKGHRICKTCWWDPISGFARENTDHSCPGCNKNLTLTNMLININNNVIIDLSEE